MEPGAPRRGPQRPDRFRAEEARQAVGESSVQEKGRAAAALRSQVHPRHKKRQFGNGINFVFSLIFNSF